MTETTMLVREYKQAVAKIEKELGLSPGTCWGMAPETVQSILKVLAEKEARHTEAMPF